MFRHPGFILRKSALVHGSGDGLTDPQSHRARTLFPIAIFVSTYCTYRTYCTPYILYITTYCTSVLTPRRCFNASIWLDGASLAFIDSCHPKPSRYTMIAPGIMTGPSGLDILVFPSAPLDNQTLCQLWLELHVGAFPSSLNLSAISGLLQAFSLSIKIELSGVTVLHLPPSPSTKTPRCHVMVPLAQGRAFLTSYVGSVRPQSAMHARYIACG